MPNAGSQVVGEVLLNLLGFSNRPTSWPGRDSEDDARELGFPEGRNEEKRSTV